MKRLPWTGLSFLVGSAAISGLPPFNGFVSEFLIYLGAFSAVALSNPGIASSAPGAAFPAVGAASPAFGAASKLGVVFPAVGVIAALALIGGLAAACFTKAFGAVFLGEPRGGGHAAEGAPGAEAVQAAHAGGGVGIAAGNAEPGFPMRFPLIALAAACLFIGLAAPLMLKLLRPVLAAVTGIDAAELGASLSRAGGILVRLTSGCLGLVVIAALLALVYRRLLARNGAARGITWDCGYIRPTARMQYTPSSFAQPIVELFSPFLRTRRKVVLPEGYFPPRAEWTTITPDFSRTYLYAPAFQAVRRTLARLRWLQQGRLQLYILYIAVTLFGLLFWKMR